ncbi:MAG: hypothetical protein II961_05660 [Candidatus Riflebacteria bacterium]|nr:hypothetical protein [Candidatus Riflebacteria bacterium]
MKKYEKILLATVFLSLLPVTSLFALSKEATEIIEAMRIRLRLAETLQQPAAQVAPTKKVSDDEYVPGRELSAALAKVRRERYDAENRVRRTSHKVAVEEATREKGNTPIVAIDDPKEEQSTNTQGIIIDAVPAQTEEKVVAEKEVVEDVPQTSQPQEVKEDNSSDELIIIEAMEADDSEAWAIPIYENNQNNSQSDNIANKSKKADTKEYVPGQLLQQSVKRIRHSRRRNTPASAELDTAIEDYEKRLANKRARNSKEVIENANDEIEELFNNSEKRSSLAERERSKATSDEDDQIDDDQFNDYISKYNFKMPENYRIIVE